MKVIKKLNRALSVLLVAAMVTTLTPDVCLVTYAAEGEEATTEESVAEETVDVVADAEPAEVVQDSSDDTLPASDTESNDISANDVSDTTDQNTEDGNTAGEEDVVTSAEDVQPVEEAEPEVPVAEENQFENDGDDGDTSTTTTITITKTDLISTVSSGTSDSSVTEISFSENVGTISVEDTSATIYFEVVTSEEATVTVSGVENVTVSTDDNKTHKFSVAFGNVTALTITAEKKAATGEPEEDSYTVTYTAADNVVYGEDNAESVKVSELGENFEFVVTAADEFEITSVKYTVGGATLDATKSGDKENTYLVPTTAITGNVVITATAEVKTVTVGRYENENVEFPAMGSAPINVDAEYAIKAKTGYSIEKVVYTVDYDSTETEAKLKADTTDTYVVPKEVLASATSQVLLKVYTVADVYDIKYATEETDNFLYSKYNDNTVTYGEAFSFQIKPLNDYEITVSATVGSGDDAKEIENIATESLSTGYIKYTIAAEDVTGDITITVKEAAVQYKATIVKEDSASIIDKIEYTTKAVTEKTTLDTEKNSFEVVKKDSIKLYVTLKEAAANTRQEVVVTVDDKEVEAVDGAYTISNKGDVTVTVTTKEVNTNNVIVTVPSGVTVKYTDDAEATVDDLQKLDEITAATEGADAVVGLKGVDVGKTYYLFVTADEGKAVKSVTYGEAVSSTVIEAGRAYPIKITSSAEEKVAIAVDDSYTVTVNADNATTYYAETDVTFDKENFEEFTTVNTVNPIYLHVVEDDNYEVESVKATIVYTNADGEDETAESTLAETTNKNYAIAPAKADCTVKSVTIDVTTKRIEHTFTFVANEAVEILDAAGEVIVASVGESKEVIVPQGDTYKFQVRVTDEDIYDVNSTTARYATDADSVDEGTMATVRVEDGKEMFSVPSTATGDLFIKGYADKIPDYAVTFESDSDQVAKVSVKVNGAEAVEVALTDCKATTAEMKSGSTFAFKPEMAEGSKYVVQSVSIGDEELSADEDGYFTIAGGVVDAYTVTIKTELAAENARIITLNADEDVTISFTDSSESKILSAGESYRTENIEAINFTVDISTYSEYGYEIDKVTVDGEEVTAADAKYSLAAVAAVGTTQEITVTLKAKAAEKDKYIKLVEANGAWYDITTESEEISFVEGSENVYKIANGTTDPFTFNVYVPYGKEFTGFDGIDEKTVTIEKPYILGEGIDRIWVYECSVSSYLIAAGTEAEPTTLTPVVQDDMIQVTVTEGTFASVKVDGENIYDNLDFFKVAIGAKVVVEVADGKYLCIVNGDDKEYVELDALNKYVFTATEDISFAIEELAVEGYQIISSAPEVDYVNNNTVEIHVTDTEGNSVAIDSAEFSAEGVASTITLNENKTVATVTVDEADAGKILEVVLGCEETSKTGRVQKVEVGVATIKVAPIVTSVTVSGIKNKATVKANAGSIMEYPFTIGTPGAYLDLVTLSVTAEGKNEAATKVEFVNEGTLRITTPEEAETAQVVIATNTKVPKTLLTFKVVTTANAPKVSKVESPVQGYDNLIVKVTADKAINSADYDGKLYYAITVEPVAPKANETQPDVLSRQIFYEEANTDTITKDIQVIKHVDTTKNTAWKFNVSAQLVVVKSDVVPEDNKSLKEEQIVSASNAVTKTFSTRNAYYEDKLGVTKKTTNIYQGQNNVLAGIVKFSKNASYITNVEAFAYNTDGTINQNITATVDQLTGEVYVTVNSDVTSGKYNIVILADAYYDEVLNEQTMYRATATLPITVLRSIKSISASAPAQITVTDTKAATITLKPVGYSDEWGKKGQEKAKTQKFTYELKFTNNANQELVNAVTIKNNKVTIAKGYKVTNDPEDNTFTIVVKAADYAGNEVQASYDVEVTNENLVLSKAYLVDKETGEVLDTTVTTSEVLDLSVGGNMYESSKVKLVVLDDENQPVDSDLYTVKVSNTKSVYLIEGGEIPNVVFVNKAAKNVTFTVTTKDGGNKKVVSPKYTFTYIPVETIEASWVEAEQPVLVETAENTYEYKGTYNNVIQFKITAKDAEGKEICYLAEPYNNVKVSAKGGKAALSSNNTVSIVPSAEKTSVTIKEASTGKTLTINLTDKAYVKTAAPGLKAGNKIYADYYETDGTVKSQDLKLYINKNNAYYAYLRLIPDYGDGLGIAGEYCYPSYDNKKYYYTISNVGGDNALTAGTYKYTAIYGYYDNGQFIAQTKPTTISIKVDKLATFKPTTSYTINPFEKDYVNLTGKPVDVNVTFSNLQNANVKGQPNKFRDYFELNGNTLWLKSGLTYDQIKSISKNDLTGYVTYTYVCGTGEVSKTTKITVKLNLKQAKYTATQFNVLSLDSTTGYTGIYAGKSSVYMENAKVYTDSTDWTVVPSGSGMLLTSASPEVRTHKIKIWIVPTESPYYKSDMTVKEIQDYGSKVEVKVNVVAKNYDKKIKENTKLQTYDLNNYYYTSYDSWYENTPYGNTVYNNVAQSIQWTLYNNAVINNNKYYYCNYIPFYMTVQNDSIINAEIKGDAPSGVTLVYVGNTEGVDSSRWTFIINKAKVKQNTTINVPVEVTFANGTEKEIINYTFKTPKTYLTVEDVAAYAESYIKWNLTTAGNATSDAENAKSTLTNNFLRSYYSEFEVSAATGEAVNNESGAFVTSKVTLTLKNKVDGTTAEFTVTLGQNSQTESEALAIATEYMDTLLNVSETDANKASLESDATIYSIRENILAFESATNKEKIDTNQFMVKVEFVSKTDAKEGTTGSITVKYSIVDRKTLNAGQTFTVTKVLKALEVAPTE